MNINYYSDSDRLRDELRSGIINQIGLPHQYKNHEFGGCNPPIILFGCPIASEPLQDDSPAACAVHAFQRLAEFTRSLGTPPRNDESEVVLRKVRNIGAHWNLGNMVAGCSCSGDALGLGGQERWPRDNIAAHRPGSRGLSWRPVDRELNGPSPSILISNTPHSIFCVGCPSH